MRRTSTLRLFVLDRSELAKNMYRLLFNELPGYQLEFAESSESLIKRQRRARPHVVLVNSNSLEPSIIDIPDFIKEYPTVLISSPARLDLKNIARDHDNATFVEKPFYPYDLITIINRLAAKQNPLSSSTEPAPTPKRVRMKGAQAK